MVKQPSEQDTTPSEQFEKLDAQARRIPIVTPRISFADMDRLFRLPGIPAWLSRILVAGAAAGVIGCALDGDYKATPHQDTSAQASSPDAGGSGGDGGAGGEPPEPKKYGVMNAGLTLEGFEPLTPPEKPAFDGPDDWYWDTAQCVVDGQPYTIFTVEGADEIRKIKFAKGTPENPEDAMSMGTAGLLQGMEKFIGPDEIACHEDKIFFEAVGIKEGVYSEQVRMGTLIVVDGQLTVTDIVELPFSASELSVMTIDGIPYLYGAIGSGTFRVPINELPSDENGEGLGLDGSCSLPTEIYPPKDGKPGMYFGAKKSGGLGQDKICKLYAATTPEGIATSALHLIELNGTSTDVGHVSAAPVFDKDGYFVKAFITFIKKVGGKWKMFSTILKKKAPEAPDITPPAAVSDLYVSGETQTSISLEWTEPGDDGDIGTATGFDLRYSKFPITEANWDSATQAMGEPAPSGAGETATVTIEGLEPGTGYYVAMKSSDEKGNKSPLSNVAVGYTTDQIPDQSPADGDTMGGDTQDGVDLLDAGPHDTGSTPDTTRPASFSTFKRTAGGLTISVNNFTIGSIEGQEYEVSGKATPERKCTIEFTVNGIPGKGLFTFSDDTDGNIKTTCRFHPESAPTCKEGLNDTVELKESGHKVKLVTDSGIETWSPASHHSQTDRGVNADGQQIFDVKNFPGEAEIRVEHNSFTMTVPGDGMIYRVNIQTGGVFNAETGDFLHTLPEFPQGNPEQSIDISPQHHDAGLAKPDTTDQPPQQPPTEGGGGCSGSPENQSPIPPTTLIFLGLAYAAVLRRREEVAKRLKEQPSILAWIRNTVRDRVERW